MSPPEVRLAECTKPVPKIDPARRFLGDEFDYVDLSSVDQARKEIRHQHASPLRTRRVGLGSCSQPVTFSSQPFDRT